VNKLARLLYGFAATVMASGGLLHALAWPKADSILTHSALPPFYAAACRGLWLADCAGSLILALVFAQLAVRPAASRWLVVALSLMPLSTAVAILATVGPFYPAWLLLAASCGGLLAAVLDGSAVTLARSASPLGAT
jgi:hypothetical protein